jgi:hypothetical protein
MRGEKAGIDGERKNTMKRLLSAALAGTMALSLLGATAASAQPYGHGGFGHGGYGHGWHGHDNTGALVGLGIGLFALGAIAAASNHDRYYDRYDYGPPPPPPPAYGPAYGYGYGYRY